MDRMERNNVRYMEVFLLCVFLGIFHPKPVNVFSITVTCLINWRTICQKTSNFPEDPAVLATLKLTGRLRAEDSFEIGAGAGQDLCSGITTLGPSGGEYLQAGVDPIKRRQVPTTVWCSSTMAEQGDELVLPKHFWNWPTVSFQNYF